MTFHEVDPKVSFPDLEQQVAAWWNEHGIVNKALAHGDRSRPFVFFEGPPTANGRPGVHHVEARVFKDIVNRYRRMCGQYVVGARGGWDTHGLPVEVEVEKELGFRGKPDIERYGIAEFNAKCKESVNRYVDAFEQLTERIAFWLDLEHPYRTYDNSYIESLWWIMQQLWQKDLLFRDYKVTMHCPRCGTTLADAEVAQGFREDVDDPSVWVKFKVRADGAVQHAASLHGASFVAWTTTPWTLPANVALAVKPNAEYALVEYTGGNAPERLILAAALAERVLGEGNYRVLHTFKGEQLRDVHYERLFDGLQAPGEAVGLDQAYHVVADNFVSLDDGTGIVHIAPAYGDLDVGRTHALPTLFSVDLSGNTLPMFDELGFGGMFFKQADPLITRNLQERGLLFKSARVRHAYPFCWRCGTALLYYAKPSWYIRTTAKKELLLENNAQIHWVPEHIKYGRFGNWLQNNIDWAVSRERYWGTPLPIWICDECNHVAVIGSVAELSSNAGQDLSALDLHRPAVDRITWACHQCGGGTMQRVPDVADAWFDSGSMPVAQWHYPFENQDVFAIAGQADFISEAIDQTRGWFYTLHAVSTLLFDRPAFKNVICLGHILDVKGEKMSKSRGNVVDPFMLVEQYGADATRWYMYASAPPYNPRRFAPEQIGEVLRQFMLTLWNTYSFFVTYANLDGWQPTMNDGRQTMDGTLVNPLDRWALARLNALVRDVTAGLDEYDIYGPAKAIEAFVDDLSNWYVRRSRRRFWKAESDADKQAAYQTLYTCLTTLARLLAPFTPYLAEAMYQNLAGTQSKEQRTNDQSGDAAAGSRFSALGSGDAESVHLAPWPAVDEALIDAQLIADTALLLNAISLGRAARRSAGVKVRQPLAAMLVRVPPASVESLRRFEDELREELNIKDLNYLDGSAALVEYRLKPNLRAVGKKYGKLVPALTAALRDLDSDAARTAAQAAEAGQPYSLDVNSETLDLLPEEMLVESSSPEGYAVAEGGGVLVALDTTLTPELQAEGLARELVRNIQDARKNAGFAIADRISVFLDGDAGTLADALQTWGDYVRAETLADDLHMAAAPAEAHTESLDVNGATVTVGVLRRG